MCSSETAGVGKIWNFDFRRIPFEQKEEVEQRERPALYRCISPRCVQLGTPLIFLPLIF